MSKLKEDKRAYSESRTALGNIGILLWIALGTIAIWSLSLVGALIFAFVAFIVVYGVVRKQLCKTCAYCKTCTMGFGKLSELIFGKAELGGVKPRTLQILLVVTYSLLTVIPTVLLAVSINQEFTLYKILLLAFPLLILSYSVATKRKREFMKN
ncbi:MAG: hypothetical protein ABSB71_08325 [Candidatus Bathyarchaeia archaeon]